MGKDKLKKFAENKTFRCLVQPEFDEIFGKDHPLKGRWHADFFRNDRPIVLELGCGKGEYTVALAADDPARNYIGVDIKGARMWRGAKTATEQGMDNVGFLRTRIVPRNVSPHRPFWPAMRSCSHRAAGSTSKPTRSTSTAIRAR